MLDKSLLPYPKHYAAIFRGGTEAQPLSEDRVQRGASKLLRQREDVNGVAAAGRVRLRSQAHTKGRDRAATSRDGDVLASVDRIRDGPTDDLRGKPRLPH